MILEGGWANTPVAGSIGRGRVGRLIGQDIRADVIVQLVRVKSIVGKQCRS